MNEVVTDEDQGSCCSFLKSTVKIIFDIYNEEQEYIQAAEGEGGGLFSLRGTFGTANIQPIPTHSNTVLLHPFVFCLFTRLTGTSS